MQPPLTGAHYLGNGERYEVNYCYSHMPIDIGDLEWPWRRSGRSCCLILPNLLALGPITSPWLKLDPYFLPTNVYAKH